MTIADSVEAFCLGWRVNWTVRRAFDGSDRVAIAIPLLIVRKETVAPVDSFVRVCERIGRFLEQDVVADEACLESFSSHQQGFAIEVCAWSSSPHVEILPGQALLLLDFLALNLHLIYNSELGVLSNGPFRQIARSCLLLR